MFCARARNTWILFHFLGTRILISSWRRAKKEDVEVDTPSEWVKSIADVLKRRNRRPKRPVNTRHESIFCDPEVVRELSSLHENFVIVPAVKASYNYTVVCKKYNVSILIEELGLNSLAGNPTYNFTILQNFLHQKCWTTTNMFSLSMDKIQKRTKSICHICIWFQNFSRKKSSPDEHVVKECRISID